MVPENDDGLLMYNEHISRYIFAGQFIKNKIVLDIACGSGYGGYYLLNNGAKEVIGVDNSGDAVSYARYKYHKKNLFFLKGDAENLAFPNNKFDVIVSMETIEHLRNPQKFIKEIKRVLKQGGLLIISTPNALVYPKGNTFHIKEFTPEKYKIMLKKYFKNLKMFFQGNTIVTYIKKDNKKFNNKKYEYLQLNKLINGKKPLLQINNKEDMFMLALASDSTIPDIKDVIITSGSIKLAKYINILNREVNRLKGENHKNNQQLSHIYHSRGWKILSFFHFVRLRIPVLKKI